MEDTASSTDQIHAQERAYRFVLTTFEGPLDMLLHLLRVNELDIMDLPVVEIARQYDQMIGFMEELDLEIAGDFLVMAATLVYIKSKLLLPVDQERIEQGLEEDPRKNLVQALLEHQRFRQAAEELAEREREAALIFSRLPVEDPEGESYLEVSLFDLLGAFKRILEAAEKKAALARSRDEMSLAERIAEIRLCLEQDETVDFAQLVGESSDVEMMVVTFLAILELVRTGAIRLYQPRPFADIRLRRVAA